MQAGWVGFDLVKQLKDVLPLVAHVLLDGHIDVVVAQDVLPLLPIHVLHALVDDRRVGQLVQRRLILMTFRAADLRPVIEIGLLAEGDFVDLVVGVERGHLRWRKCCHMVVHDLIFKRGSTDLKFTGLRAVLRRLLVLEISVEGCGARQVH